MLGQFQRGLWLRLRAESGLCKAKHTSNAVPYGFSAASRLGGACQICKAPKLKNPCVSPGCVPAFSLVASAFGLALGGEVRHRVQPRCASTLYPPEEPP